jgi:hypothetical protein
MPFLYFLKYLDHSLISFLFIFSHFPGSVSTAVFFAEARGKHCGSMKGREAGGETETRFSRDFLT